MFRQHIDFVAVFVIAVAMLAFSQLASLRVPDFRDSVLFQNALVNTDPCPVAQHVLALFN
jgi:hypothetical protein